MPIPNPEIPIVALSVALALTAALQSPTGLKPLPGRPLLLEPFVIPKQPGEFRLVMHAPNCPTSGASSRLRGVRDQRHVGLE
jgi:hypothetical protein